MNGCSYIINKVLNTVIYVYSDMAGQNRYSQKNLTYIWTVAHMFVEGGEFMFNKNTENEIEVCQKHCIHEDVVSEVRKEQPTDEMLADLADLFKVFGDSTRIKIIYSLFEREMCVCDIAELLGMTQSAISHQLRVLKNSRLVKFRKEGKTVFYSLDDEHVGRIFDCGLCHVKEMYY